MKHPYEDILYRPRPVSPGRAKMSVLDRAAQFAPFAALTGYDAAVAETARLTTRPVELAADEKAALDDKLRLLRQRTGEQPLVCVTWFIPDAKKAGGSYVSRSGRIVKLSSREQLLTLEDGTQVPFGDILTLESPIFDEWKREIWEQDEEYKNTLLL